MGMKLNSTHQDGNQQVHEAEVAELRRAIQEGIDSGASTAWEPSEIKDACRAKRSDQSGDEA